MGNTASPMAVAITPEASAAMALVAERIIGGFHPDKIILFGSHARGEADALSDIDFLVVMPDMVDKRDTTVAITRALGDLTVPTDIIVTTPEEIVHRGRVIGSVLRTALREGKSLYERQ